MTGKLLRIRYSVRTFLVVCSLLAIALTAIIHPYYQQNRGFHAIFFKHGVSCFGSDTCPDFIRATLPKGYYTQIEELHFHRPVHDDHTLELLLPHISRLGELRRVDFRNCGISDDGLAYLTEFPVVKFLWLTGEDFTDAGLKHIQNINGLEELQLTGTNISENGIVELREALPNLEISAYKQSSQ